MSKNNNNNKTVSHKKPTIDCIPPCKKKPRTAGSPRTPRTDFSLFPSSSKSHSAKGSGLEGSDRVNKLCTATESEDQREEMKGNVVLSLPACCSAPDKKRRLFTNAMAGNKSVGRSASRDSAWVDPATNISEFDKCFEERSSNSSDGLQGYQTPEKLSSSSSSRTESLSGDSRRGKRERKPKLHFDEEPAKLTLARGVRQIKIMRSLGLAAPIGSPF